MKDMSEEKECPSDECDCKYCARDRHYESLESRLKEAQVQLERALNIHHVDDLNKIQSLEHRLSQADAENKRLEKQAEVDLEKLTEAVTLGATQAEEYDKKLSHLMDVAESLAHASRQVIECGDGCGHCYVFAKGALAEWDGIKSKQ